MRANLIVALAAAAMALAPSAARAMPNHCYSLNYPTTTMAAIGDSISVGTDAYDMDLHVLSDFIGALGADWQGSWTVGDVTTQTWPNGYSIKKRLGASYALFTKTSSTTGCVYDSASGLYDCKETGEADVLNLTNGFSSPVRNPKNGNKWVDGPVQANAILQSCLRDSTTCPQTVTIELGGNDVCKTGPTPAWDPDATTQSYIDQTAATLGQLPAGTEVFVNTMPNIDNYRSVAANMRNWVFHSCQDLWNLDTSKLDPAPVCDKPGWWCSIQNYAEKILADITSKFLPTLQWILQAVFGLNTTSAYPCWSQTNSVNTSYRPTGIAKNTFINNYLVQKFCASSTAISTATGDTTTTAGYDSGAASNPSTCRDIGKKYGNVRFYLATSLKSLQFDKDKVSMLDCFHPSRKGQELIATSMMNDLCTGGSLPKTCAGPAPQAGAPGTPVLNTVSVNYTNSTSKYTANHFMMNTACTPSQLCLWVRNPNALGGANSYDKFIGCTPQFSDTHELVFTVNPPGSAPASWWLVWELKDSGNTETAQYASTGTVTQWRYPPGGGGPGQVGTNTAVSPPSYVSGYVGPQIFGGAPVSLY